MCSEHKTQKRQKLIKPSSHAWHPIYQSPKSHSLLASNFHQSLPAAHLLRSLWSDSHCITNINDASVSRITGETVQLILLLYTVPHISFSGSFLPQFLAITKTVKRLTCKYVRAKIWLRRIISPLISQRDSTDTSRHPCVGHELLAHHQFACILQCNKMERADIHSFGRGDQKAAFSSETRFHEALEKREKERER